MKGIVRTKDIQHNTPRIEGTRIPTECIYDLACAGWTYQRIQSDGYPVTREQIDACVRYERSPRRRLARRVEALRTRLIVWLDERY